MLCLSDVASTATSGTGSCTADFMGRDEVPGDDGLGLPNVILTICKHEKSLRRVLYSSNAVLSSTLSSQFTSSVNIRLSNNRDNGLSPR